MIRIGFVSLFAAAGLLAQTPAVKFAALEAFQHRFDGRLVATPGPYPFEILSTAPAIYIPTAGVVLTSVVNLAYTPEPSPFRPAFTPKELLAIRKSKVDKVAVLEQHMREIMADTAADAGFDSVLPTERIVLGVTLFYFSWEDSAGLPRQITMVAEKQKLLQARREKLDLAAVIQEQKL